MNHQKQSREEIIIFTRYPRAGTTKTRLIPKLGADGAAGIHRSMTEKILREARGAISDNGPHLCVYYTGGTRQLMEEWLGAGTDFHAQAAADLGQRMMAAFQEAWSRGAKRAVLVGSDCPGIDTRLLTDALTALRSSQLVLGPATDGGYYLIGTTDSLPAKSLSLLFKDIAWGTSSVFLETITRADQACIAATILKQLHDIDHPGDLAYFHHHPDPQ